MNDAGHAAASARLFEKQPYRELYIYYCAGRLARDIAIDDDAFIGNWEEDDFSFLFFSAPAGRRIADLLATQTHMRLLDQFQMTYDQWHGEPLQVLNIGGFAVVPPWLQAPKALEADRQILLDPGVVFGTGTHPTTGDCLIALRQVFDRGRIETVLDLGTGTGLLALAAARLGAQRVVAVDLNMLAVRTAKRNIRLNQLEDRILAVRGLAENFIDFPSDLVVSNIHYDVMKRLLASNSFLHTKWFILSGLLHSQAQAILALLAQQPVKILQKWERDGIWHTFLGMAC
jgi:ribosomal protein L11 methyltransferase